MTSQPNEHALDDRRPPKRLDDLARAITVDRVERLRPVLRARIALMEEPERAEDVGVLGWIDGSATGERPSRLGGNQWSGKRHTAETKRTLSLARAAYWARRREDQ